MRVSVAGDFCQRHGLDSLVKEKRFEEMFGEIKPVIEQTDYSIVNFEFPIVVNDKIAFPIQKLGPNLKGTIEAISAIKYAGFNCCTLANNHINDQGPECALSTKIELEKHGLDTVGIGRNLVEASNILYVELNGDSLAIINCCEHEFSIATDNNAGANPLNPIQQYYQIGEAKRRANYVLVIVHGGHELYQLPSPRMQETYRFFIDAGADAVVNHHQHCYSGYEIYNKKPIFYGLGNFLFDNGKSKKSKWNEGYVVCLDTKENSFDLIPYKQCVDALSIRLLNESEKINFYKSISNMNEIIQSEGSLKSEFSKFARCAERGIISSLSPYSNVYVQELCSRRFIPSFVSKKKIISLINYLDCESHKDLMVEVLHSCVLR